MDIKQLKLGIAQAQKVCTTMNKCANKFILQNALDEMNEALMIPDVTDSLRITLRTSADNEITFIRESPNGLKYLIVSDELISYSQVGKGTGKYNLIHFDGTNGIEVVTSFSNDM